MKNKLTRNSLVCAILSFIFFIVGFIQKGNTFALFCFIAFAFLGAIGFWCYYLSTQTKSKQKLRGDIS
jgi:asparagine N-glycosylation enzyme membrane subunit Stt3